MLIDWLTFDSYGPETKGGTGLLMVTLTATAHTQLSWLTAPVNWVMLSYKVAEKWLYICVCSVNWSCQSRGGVVCILFLWKWSLIRGSIPPCHSPPPPPGTVRSTLAAVTCKSIQIHKLSNTWLLLNSTPAPIEFVHIYWNAWHLSKQT